MLPLLSPSHLRIVQSFPGSSAGKESACNTEDLRSIPGLGRSPGEGKGYPLQYSGLENPVDCWVHGVTQSQTRLKRLSLVVEKVKVKVTQSCLTLCHPTDFSPPGSSVRGILQVSILEWVAVAFSKWSFLPRDWTQISHITGGFFAIWAIRETHLPMQET